METYTVRVKGDGALSWKSKRVALHDPTDLAALTAQVRNVLGRLAKSGDRIEVLSGSKTVVKPFTVP